MHKFLKYIFYSNAFIALSGGIYAFHDAITNGFEYTFYGVIFLCTSTWLSYQLPLINTFILTGNEPVKPKDIWFVAHKNAMVGLSIIMSCVALYCFVHLKPHRQCLFTILSVVSFFYVLPFSKYSLRNIPYLKIFIIASSWAALSVFWWRPVNSDALILFFIRTISIVAITLPFDLRDIPIDRTFGLKTIPMLLNKKNVITLAFTLLTIATGLSFCLSYIPTFEMVFIFLAVLALSFHKLENDDLYYYLVLDGIFLIHGLMVLSFFKITC